MNVFVRDLLVINNLDERRLEVVVDGLPLAQGSRRDKAQAFFLLFCCLLHLGKTARHAPPRMEHSGGLRWMVAHHSRAAASSSEVASRQGSEAHAAEAHCDCATGRFGASAVEVAGSPEEIPSRGRRSCINEDLSNSGGDRQPWSGRHRGEVQFRSRVVSCPTSPCDPSSRQAHRRHVSFHCTGEETYCSRVSKDRAGVGTGGEGSGMFPTGGRDFTTCRQESQDPVAVLEAELSRARAGLAQLKGVDPDAPCGPSVKRPCRTGEGRGCIPAMPSRVEYVVGGTPCRPPRRSSPGRQ